MKCRFFHQLSITLRFCHFSFIHYYIIHTNNETNLCINHLSSNCQTQAQNGVLRDTSDLEDITLLSNLVADESFQKAVKTHEKLKEQLVPGGDVDLTVKSARGVTPETSESIERTDDMLK